MSQWIWHKLGSPGMGYHSRVDHELVLIGKRGRPKSAPPTALRSSVFATRKGRHSEKPEEVYDQIDRMYPEATKLELFARKARRPGWKFWGNELRDEAGEGPIPALAAA